MNLYLITGTTKGLGAALRKVLVADAGNRVITLSRAPTTGLADGRNTNIYADFGANIGDVASLPAAFLQIEQQLAGNTFARAVLINNAGVVAPVGRFDSLDSIALANNIQVNLTAPMVVTGWFAKATRGIAAERLVINISSGAATRAIAGWSAYCAAKAGLEMATRAAALEAAANDPTLAICSLAPGVVDTPMQGEVRAASEDAFPDVARFRTMKSDGVLRPAEDVARDIVRLIDDGRLSNGGNFDLRELIPQPKK